MVGDVVIMLIDFHTHAFPDKIAQTAIPRLADASGGLIPQTNGTLSGLKRNMIEEGTDLSVVLSIATNPRQQTNVNDFAIQINREEGIVAFGSVHPDAPDVLHELERIKAAGLKGIKFHPEYQQFYADDEKMKPIYRKISSLGLITVFHAGNDLGCPPPYHCLPDNLTGALKWFDTPVIAAHWGGLGRAGEVIDKLCGKEIYFDTAFGYATMYKGFVQKIVEKHTPDKILFGSDMPWHSPTMEKRLIESLDLTTEDNKKIYYKNAKKLLKI